MIYDNDYYTYYTNDYLFNTVNQSLNHNGKNIIIVGGDIHV